MTNRAGIALYTSLKGNPLFDWVQVRSGRAPGDADGAGVSMAHVDVELSDAALKNREESIKQLREAFTNLPYLLSHFRRDMRSLSTMLDSLDLYSLETQRPITLPLLRELLQAEAKE